MELGSSTSFKRQRRSSSCCRKNRIANGLLPNSPLILILFALLNWHHLNCDALSLSKSSGTTTAMSSSSYCNNDSEITTNAANPLFSVGIIADIQYAPIPDGYSYSGTPRYYRHSLEATKHAFQTFRDYQWPGDDENKDNDGDSSDSGNGVDFVINLGDIIDGKCQEIEKNGGCLPPSQASADGETLWKDLLNHPGMLSLLEIKNAMKPYHGDDGNGKARRVLHSYGNHCLYNLNRTELRDILGIPFRVEQPVRGFGSIRKLRQDELMQRPSRQTNDSSDGDDDDDGDLVGYYSYEYPPPQTDRILDNKQSVKFIVLDGYDIALMRRSPGFSQKRKQAMDILKSQNGKNFAKGDENSPEGLEGLQKRFVAFNGAIGSTQLEWLRDELENTRQQNGQQKVIILSHQPIHPESCNPVCLIWNYDVVLEILREYSDVVVASFAGHAHKGGYAFDETSGIHFRVIEAVLESKPPTKTFGILNVYNDRLELTGYGDCESAVYHFHGADCADGEEEENKNEAAAASKNLNREGNVCAPKP
mmetsp:Transcript_20759/g.51494  ORF Transcript_20759/g.51494 Transcript_20759/m.51494 type:complete len:534 (-) Transcript_20759:123-1724(-)